MLKKADMYICEECKRTFEEPLKTSYEALYGVLAMFETTTKIDVCPYCESFNFEDYEDYLIKKENKKIEEEEKEENDKKSE